MARAYIGLGSNLNQPLRQVRDAIAELARLPETVVAASSSWYRSKAVGPGDQPDYVNGVAALDTSFEPEPLLDALQAIEKAHQRVRELRWGPRTLDLDILLYDELNIVTERLQVPHPWLEQRNFVLLPLAEVAPDLRLPNGTTVEFLVNNISREGITRLGNL